MRWPMAPLTVAGALTATAVFAQTPFPDPAMRNPAPPSNTRPAAGTAARSDPNVVQANAADRVPLTPDQLQPATMPLPGDPIEPYLLKRENGPFMVMAKTFRGVDAERCALALVLELRNEYGLPAYILRWKDFPGSRSYVYNLPPTAPRNQQEPQLAYPERIRSLDEAAVLVGDEKTLAASEALLHRVKKIKPKCLNGMKHWRWWETGLSKALRTTNPFVPAQDLYPGKQDPLVIEMNQGPRSIYNCPGRYTLIIADFSGRSTFNVDGAQLMGDKGLKRSPLITAHDDAERLAAALAKADEIRQLGQPIYVFHDRTSSKVMIGAFDAPNDPRAAQLHDYLVQNAGKIMDYTKRDTNNRVVEKRKRGIDHMIAPAGYLTDLDPIKPKSLAAVK